MVRRWIDDNDDGEDEDDNDEDDFNGSSVK